MEQTPNTPPAPTPAPAAAPTLVPTVAPVTPTPSAAPAPVAAQPQHTHWSLIIGSVFVLLLIAAGIYAFYTYGGYEMFMSQPAPVQEEQTTTQQPSDSIDAIEADLNAGGEASTSGDVDALQQSF